MLPQTPPVQPENVDSVSGPSASPQGNSRTTASQAARQRKKLPHVWTAVQKRLADQNARKVNLLADVGDEEDDFVHGGSP